ncbi:mannose-P-dolichol utilization defect 1 protein-like [Gigantopelta aegis]|uniref:mannose-P-dolichol utilization defect 1 protein-like n=1 Tax=Gigantopelta aegis TaxID=1735272 RepID=UPI001B88D66C|nr:mannose-P-dolichol utilization defect 1 protein-like [Gigantopelta aegis]
MEKSFVPAVLAGWIQLIVPQPCFDEFFLKFNLLHVPCLKVVISKCLGYAIILGACIVKIPQIVKILRSQSAVGISLLSVTCELLAISASWSYGFAKQFPFSSYGEAMFLGLQTSSIAFLIFYYNGKTTQGLLYLVGYVITMVFLLSPLASLSLLAVLQGLNVGVVAVSKLIQAYQNYSQGSTGQLSAVTVFLLFLGAVARVFTSIQETGDSLVIFTYVVASSCNGLIAAQMAYYWNAQPKSKSKTS